MGVAFSGLIEPQETSLERFQGKIIAIDAMNMLYQFLTTIRQHDGTPLKDSKGNITSHLTGLFARCTRLMQKNIKLVFVFDGKTPDLKKEERARREEQKIKAIASYKEAESTNDVTSMKKYASRSTRITPEIISEAKALLSALGIPYIDAPSEGEAQAAYMVKKGDCDYVGSQDFDCLVYGAPRMVRNLSLSQKRKKINALTYKVISPEVFELKKVLSDLDINITQLRSLAMIVGTDFNVGGIKGLGPKKGLNMVKSYTHPEDLFKEVNWESTASWEEVFELLENMPVSDDYKLEWGSVNKDAVLKLLVDEHDFSKDRIYNTLENLELARKKSLQTDLGSYFG